MRTGRKPYSVKNPLDGKWYRYNRFEPVGMLIGVSADMAEIGAAIPKKEAGDIGIMVVTSLGLNLGDKTFLRGITDFANAYSDPKRYFSRWAQGMGGTVIPNITAQAARIEDPYVREARGLEDVIKSRIPVVRRELPAKRDIAGERIERSVVEPLAATRERRDPVAEAMLELGVSKGKPGRKVTQNGRTLDLDGHEYESMVAYVQRARWKVLTPRVQSEAFQSLKRRDSMAAARQLERIYTRVGDNARQRWLRDHPEVLAKLRGAPKRTYSPSSHAPEGINP